MAKQYELPFKVWLYPSCWSFGGVIGEMSDYFDLDVPADMTDGLIYSTYTS